jgi:GntR family transcriptional regulator/MocR family aminotransferase
MTGFLQTGIDDTAVSRLALERGVTVMPLSNLYLAEPKRPGLVLGYGDADEAAIDHGVDVLARILPDAT